MPDCRGAVKEGLIVVCAVGNAGMAPGHLVLPRPAHHRQFSVGGLDDQNSLDRAKRGMYRSSYGPTIDGLQKPEIIAPGFGWQHDSSRYSQRLTRPALRGTRWSTDADYAVSLSV